MPRGRHRHSQPLHKLLPPSSVAAVAVVCAGGVWAVDDPLVLRGIAVVAGIAAVAGAVIMRSWDREAGRRVAELTRARESDQWKTDERVAELEADVDEAREIRTRLDGKLRAKRVELARLRGEHAALLRRYANAETGRASALEGRRRLAIESAVAPKALAAGGAPTPSAYLMASRALEELAANGARQAALPAARAPRGRAPRAPRDQTSPASGEQTSHGKTADGQGADGRAEDVRATGTRATEARRPEAGVPAAPSVPVRAASAVRPALPARRAATPSAIVPYERRTRQRPAGAGFDFFGTQHGTGAAGDGRATRQTAAVAAPDAQETPDAPDAEATPDAQATAQDTPDAVDADADAGARDGEGPEVIDLTEHDDTEQLEVGELRSALGS
ncbi:hypothetical protein [Streptomyces sp. 8L]|uniref:hypothetical protein n=1 Tax=Streptomyces sp. 8L TaxID=2877242 RepID=UPI001CD5CF0F|nr:hypothetical protein [Streptomyces sp. 8L]MCA1219484.1 hypothetical protein [Streptomyces sp. 8L]